MLKLPTMRKPPLGKLPRFLPFVSVRGRIVAGFGLLVLILAGVAGGSAWTERQHGSDLEHMEQRAAAASLLQEVKLGGTRALALLQQYAISGDETLVPVIRSGLATATDTLEKARAQEEMDGHEEQAAALSQIQTKAAELLAAWERVIALRQRGDVEGSTTALATALPQTQSLELEFDAASEREHQEASALRSQANRTGDLAFWFAVIAGAAGAALGLAAAVLIARSIIRPLSSLETAALAVAGGDLEARAPDAGPRELARLGATLNLMTESLLDASRRRELEEALRRSEELFRGLLDSAPLAAVIIDARGRMALVNAAAEEMFGYSRQELIGQPVEILVPERLRDAHAQQCAQFLADPATRVMAIGRDVMARRRDGTEFPVTCGMAAIQTSEGPLAISFLMDITERKRAEEALRESEAKFRTLAETAPDIIMTVDRDGTILFINRAEPGFTAEKAIGTPVYDYISPGHHDRLRKSLQRVFQTGEPDSYEVAGAGPFGRPSWYASRVGPVRRDGKVVAATVIATDITQQKQAEDELLALNQELEADRQQIERLNRSLEEKVRQRTEELRRANAQLRRRNDELQDARAQAATDALTGLSNHRAFHERIRDEVRRAQENGASLGLVMLDIDGFKRFNDSLGHLAGDQILRDLALTVAGAVGQEQAYRYGGDEFALLLPSADHRQATKVAERLRRAVARRTNGAGEPVTVSLGVAAFPDTAASAEELIYGADAAMYWAKSAGKNRVGMWSKLVQQREAGALPWYAADRAVKAPDVVTALVAALAAKDPVTSAHSQRCSWYTAHMADELGLQDDQKAVVRLAALLHDIGKLAIPDEVLFKPGPLNEEEWAQMKRHPTVALRILSQIRAVADATSAILHHHEHFNGSGYPDGLAGDQIPVASRILLVTDAFDAMTTDRPYRKAMPVDVAIEELQRHSGSQFDPAAVEAFLRILSRHGAQPLCRKAAAEGCTAVRRPSGGRAKRPPVPSDAGASAGS